MQKSHWKNELQGRLTQQVNLFNWINLQWGPHTVDRFAGQHNHQLPRYNSLHWDIKLEAVDASAQNCKGENNFVNAPFVLLPCILDLIQNQKVEASVIALVWPSQLWFQKLKSMVIALLIKLLKSNKVFVKGGKTQTLEKQEVGDLRLEAIWKQNLKSCGWSDTSSNRFIASWAPSTLSTYRIHLIHTSQLKHFCELRNSPFLDVSTPVLADYLCQLANSSQQLKSLLNTTIASIACLCEALQITNLVNSEIYHLVQALIKGGMTKLMIKSKAMPTQPFTDLFQAWPQNWLLTMENL